MRGANSCLAAAESTWSQAQRMHGAGLWVNEHNQSPALPERISHHKGMSSLMSTSEGSNPTG